MAGEGVNGYSGLSAPPMSKDGLPLILMGVALSALGIGLVVWMAKPKTDKPPSP